MNQTYGQGGGRFSGGSGYRDRAPGPVGPSPKIVAALDAVNLKTPSADLFDGIAKSIADELTNTGGEGNKSSQVRKFYDEIIRYQSAGESAFPKNLPFIRMICAHAAYAKGRGHVDDNFVAFLQGGLRKVECFDDLKMFRTLFEAVIGFMPKSKS
jgi:CRISPR-associated protein Csm2